MKILVTYFSLTGNTKKIAEAIYSEIRQNKEIKKLQEVASLDGYDLAFIGFPLHAFGPPKEVEEFLQEKVNGKNIALFITHAVAETYSQLKDALVKYEKVAAGANIVGIFNCQGELSKTLADILLHSADTNLQTFGKMRDSNIGQPDASRIKKAKVFAGEIFLKLK